MRQSEDPEFAAALRRLRITSEDIELLNSRVCAPLNTSTAIPIVVRRHKLRHVINSSKLQQASETSRVLIIHCLAKITRKSKISVAEAYRLKGGTTELKADGILSLIPGEPLIINQNIDRSLGLVNGALIEFYDFADKDGLVIRDQLIRTLPAYTLIKLKHDVGIQVNLPDLPPNVIGTQPEEIKYSKRKKSVTFTQFPISLAYAITDYKCQGQIFNWVIVDLKKPGGRCPSASPYVQLSRARIRHRLSILRSFRRMSCSRHFLRSYN